MFKRVSVLAFSLVAAGCATTTSETATTAAEEVCTTEQVEATGSRVQTERTCQPATR